MHAKTRGVATPAKSHPRGEFVSLEKTKSVAELLLNLPSSLQQLSLAGTPHQLFFVTVTQSYTLQNTQ